MSDETKRRVYELSDDHAFEWADVEELVPQEPEVPETLLPFYLTGEAVENVNDLGIYDFPGAEPEFAPNSVSVEATPQEVAEWLAVWARVQQAQQMFRQRLEEARRAYEAAARDALADLAEAMEPWGPVEAELKSRSTALAAKLHAHRVAAEEWKAKKEAERQEQLDAVHGPRVIALYRPKYLGSYNTADHVAKVHLMTCKHRAKLPVHIGEDHHADEWLRAGEAWERLTTPGRWARADEQHADRLRVKFCASCKPWTVFQEHMDDFPRPVYGRNGYTLGEVRLTGIPQGWSK